MKPERQPHAYRTPADPGGYLGGYNWRPTLAGVILLVICNAAATQYIAHRFDYQLALGEVLLRVGRLALYQPFAWMIWMWRFGAETDRAVRMPLMTGVAIVVLGSCATMAVFFALNVRRSKLLSQNAEDLHGSARWATEKEIVETGLLDARQGVYVGGWHAKTAGRLHYLRHNGPEHILAFAPTRSGKGVGLVIPTLLAWSESAVVYDIKGENWAKTAGFRDRAGHLCFKFSPVEMDSARFNPLAEIRLYGFRDVSDAQNVADMLILTGGEKSAVEAHFEETAAALAMGLLLHVCYVAAMAGRVACLADLAAEFTPQHLSFRDHLNEVLSYPHDPTYERGWVTPTGDRTQTHPTIRSKVQMMLNKEEREFSGVLSTAARALALFADPLVVRNTAVSDFSVQDLVNNARPVSLYLVVPPSDKIRLRSLIRVMLTIVVNRLTERMEFQAGSLKKNAHRLLFLVDEFPSLHKMELFADALSYMAGYGLKAYLIAQDIRQIVEHYGPNESIVSNCHVRVAFAPNQIETAETISKMAGTRTVQKASFNYSGSRMAPVMSHVNASVEQIERPLITPDEVLRIRPPKKEVDGETERIVEPGDMLIFVSGHAPIYGTQMLYFKDPTLLSRSQIPPPTECYTLVDGQPRRQVPDGCTSHPPSRPEAAPSETMHEDTGETSHMEEAFMAHLTRQEDQPAYVEELRGRNPKEDGHR
jgi:type IV secretion system protein VirD4